jgi:hypothetical protein
MSFKVEVFVQGKWSGNQIRLPSRDMAIGYAKNLMDRWFLVEDYVVLESSDPVNYGWDGQQLVAPMEVPSESI